MVYSPAVQISDGIKLASFILLAFFLVGCTPAPTSLLPSPSTTTTDTISPTLQGLSADAIATLSSLEQVDDYPLYTLHYFGNYATPYFSTVGSTRVSSFSTLKNTCNLAWGCSLFAALGDPESRLYGRNFDWRFSPAMLLFTDPPDGYASVSMVDITYLGFGGDQGNGLLNLPISDRQALLDAPSLPFDGMNERGLAIGMAAVPPGDMLVEPGKPTLGELAVIREILDHAASVDQAVDILSNYNIDMETIPVHYLVASRTGDSALVEFYQGKIVVFWNEQPWQVATNFLLASTGKDSQGECPRFDRITRQLQAAEGRLTTPDALKLLNDVSQAPPRADSPTQWSIVYDISSGEVNIVMGRKYTSGIHPFRLNLGLAPSAMGVH